MYKIVYPETEEEVVPMQFDRSQEAAAYWKNSHGTMWISIDPQHPRDIAAFMQSVTGEIVVVRKFDTDDSVQTDGKKETEVSKFLVVTFSDNSRWKIPAEFIAKDRAAYYAKRDSERDGDDYYDAIYKIELAFTLSDKYELRDWASNNMNWEDVLAVRLPDEEMECDYGGEWSTIAEMKVMELEG